MTEARTSLEAPTWTCDAGTLVGRHGDGVVHATGIRYARAGRFQAPVPEPPAPEPLDATAWGPACPQGPNLVCQRAGMYEVGELPLSEDCLRLSVTAPPDARPGDDLPVMVWIHGGSYVFGAGDTPLFDPSALVREQRVVVVRVTYRLGVFGFLGREGGTPANLGLLDQLEALRWVRRNVAAFGGDPGNVTAFGESAGGDAIAHLMIAEGAKGLFRRAIIQSAPLGIARGRARMNALMAEDAAMLPADASPEDLVNAQARLHRRAEGFGLMSAMPFGVQYGHFPLPPEAEADAAWERAAADVDVLIGANAREAALFTCTLPPLDQALGLPVVGPLVELAFVKPVSWKVYQEPTYAFGRRHRRGGGRGYRYSFEWRTPDPTFSAAHIAELPLLFGGEAWARTKLVAGVAAAEVEARGRELRRIWAGFARTGTAPVGRVEGLIDIRAF